MYQLFVLIISSDNVEVYAEMKRISRQYMQLCPSSVKYFYIELKDDLEVDCLEDGDHLYVKGIENGAEGIYYKTLRAIEYINNTYDYKMIMRTNLSSFLNMQNILKYVEKCPDTNFAGGFWCGQFISGTGIFLSRDTANFIVEYEKRDQSNIIIYDDDVKISQTLLMHNLPINDITEFGWIHLVHNYFDPNIVVPDNLLYFRIKNPDRNLDIMWFKLLANKIYGITV